jgi:hypothetical protein
VGFGNVLTTEVHVETLWRRILQERGQLTQV